MRLVRALLVLFLLLFLWPLPTATLQDNDYIESLLDSTYISVNKRRADEFNLPPLKRLTALEEVAFIYAQACADVGRADHSVLSVDTIISVFTESFQRNHTEWLFDKVILENVASRYMYTKFDGHYMAHVYDVSKPHFEAIYSTNIGYIGWGFAVKEKFIYICTYIVEVDYER